MNIENKYDGPWVPYVGITLTCLIFIFGGWCVHTSELKDFKRLKLAAHNRIELFKFIQTHTTNQLDYICYSNMVESITDPRLPTKGKD